MDIHVLIYMHNYLEVIKHDFNTYISVAITVKSFIFVGLKFRGFEFKAEFVDIKFRCFLMSTKS